MYKTFHIASNTTFSPYLQILFISNKQQFLTSYQVDVKSQFSFYLLIRLSSLFIIQQLTRKMMYRSVWYVLCYYKQKLFIVSIALCGFAYILMMTRMYMYVGQYLLNEQYPFAIIIAIRNSFTMFTILRELANDGVYNIKLSIDGH